MKKRERVKFVKINPATHAKALVTNLGYDRAKSVADTNANPDLLALSQSELLPEITENTERNLKFWREVQRNVKKLNPKKEVAHGAG